MASVVWVLENYWPRVHRGTGSNAGASDAPCAVCGTVAATAVVGFHRPALSGAQCGIVTWLILPVVICLSQRLSHACLSISTCTVKLRMAH